MGKVIKWGLLFLAILIVVGGIVAWFVAASGISAVVTGAVEKYGPRYTGTTVKLDGFSVNPLSGSGAVSGFGLGNPEGFKTERSFKIDNVTVTLDTGSIMSNTVIIKEILVEKAEVTYELGMKGSNINRILENVEAAVGAAQKEGDSQTRLIIDRFCMSGSTIRMSATAMGGKTVDVALPDIELKEIGRKSNGIAAAEALRVIMGPHAGKIAVAVAGVTAAGGADAIKNVAGNAAAVGGEAAKNIADAAKAGVETATTSTEAAKTNSIETIKKTTESVKSSTDALKGLFGK